VVCFRSGNPADERLLLPMFEPYVEQGEIANLPTYNFYARMAAVLSQEPISGETLLLEGGSSEATAKAVIERSRSNYARAHKAEIKKKPAAQTAQTRPEITEHSRPNDSKTLTT
jgi:hypothetical protein